MKASGTLNKTIISVTSLIFVFSMAYAVLRYNILGQIPWKDLPLFILNKGVSLSSFFLLTASFSIGPLTNLGLKIPLNLVNSRHAFGVIGFIMAMIHMIISLVLLNPVMYDKFFLENGSLSFSAGLSMLGGILSIVVLWYYNLSIQSHLKESKMFNQFMTSKKFILMSLFFVAIHLFFMGYKSWLTPAIWQGGLPPISLISFVVFSIGFTINIFGRK